MEDIGFEPAPRERPQLDELGFDARLITPERLLRLAGGQPMRISTPEVGSPFRSLDCGVCGKAIVQMKDAEGRPYTVTAGQILQDVLRHLVMDHDVPLSGKKE